jgi:hypothetical protein
MTALANLRSFIRKPRLEEHCDLCSAAIAPHHHHHLIDPVARRLVCSCDPCAMLFDGPKARYRKVPDRVDFLPDFNVTDAQWDALRLPINLAFFYFSSTANRVIALFPSPAGATESLLPLDSWNELTASNPILNELEHDVEALLVNRIGSHRVYCRAPMDECFRLVGLIRMHWKGLSGGTEVWQKLDAFFDDLRRRSQRNGAIHA